MSRGDEVLRYLLGRGLYWDQVQRLAREAGVSASGRKDDIIERIVASHRVKPIDVLSYIEVPVLRACCEEFGLNDSGTRDVLVDRLSNYMRMSWAASLRQPGRSKRDSSDTDESTPSVVHIWVLGGFWEWAAPSIIAIVIGLVASGYLIPALGGAIGIIVSVVLAIGLFGVVHLALRRSTARVPAAK
jgi:hypothetical protein